MPFRPIKTPSLSSATCSTIPTCIQSGTRIPLRPSRVCAQNISMEKNPNKGGMNMTKEEMSEKITVASNFIAERRKRSVGRALVTTSEGIIIDVIED